MTLWDFHFQEARIWINKEKLLDKQKWFPHFNHSIVKLDNTGYLSITKGQGDDDDDDDDYDVFIKEVGDCF